MRNPLVVNAAQAITLSDLAAEHVANVLVSPIQHDGCLTVSVQNDGQEGDRFVIDVSGRLTRADRRTRRSEG